MRTVLAKFDGGYKREGEIAIGSATCTICKKEEDCITMDGSEDEYNSGYACLPCIVVAFANRRFNTSIT